MRSDWIGTIRTGLQEGSMGCTLLCLLIRLDSVWIRTTRSSESIARVLRVQLSLGGRICRESVRSISIRASVHSQVESRLSISI